MLLDIVARTDRSEGDGVECSKDKLFFSIVYSYDSRGNVSRTGRRDVYACVTGRGKEISLKLLCTHFSVKKKKNKKIISLLRNC